ELHHTGNGTAAARLRFACARHRLPHADLRSRATVPADTFGRLGGHTPAGVRPGHGGHGGQTEALTIHTSRCLAAQARTSAVASSLDIGPFSRRSSSRKR